MKQFFIGFAVVYFLLTLTWGFAEISSKIENYKPVDLVSLTDKYDGIISGKNAEIISLQEQSKEFELADSEDYDIQQLAMDYLNEKEEDELWDFWRTDVCPKYHDEYYCNDKN